MIACLLIPGFPLRAALLARPRLALRPAALAPVEGTEPLLGPGTAVAAAAGIRPGMRLGEALATCPPLVLVEQDPARAGQALVVADDRRSEFLGPLPLDLLPLERERAGELRELGVRRLGELARLPGSAVAERLGPDGHRAWSLAGGGAAARPHGRRPPAEIAEAIEFPEAIDNELTIRRALTALVDTILARPERADRFVRKLAVTAKLVGGGSWRRTATLRDPTAERDRLRAAR